MIPLQEAKAALAADLRFLVQAGHVIEFQQWDVSILPLPPRPKEEPNSIASKTSGAGSRGAPESPSAPETAHSVAEPDAQEAERAGLTVESVAVLPPDAERTDGCRALRWSPEWSRRKSRNTESGLPRYARLRDERGA